MNQIIKYTESGINLDARIEGGQAWLTYAQTAELFGIDESVVGKHARDIIDSKEIASSTTARIAVVRIEGNRSVNRVIEHLNQDMVLHIGYRVKSERGSEFRRWATMVLKGEAAPIAPAKPMTQLEMIVASATALMAVEAELQAVKADVKRLKAIAAENDQQYYTIKGWANLIGLRVTQVEAIKFGRIASAQSRDCGIAIGAAKSAEYGTVHSYHVDVLTGVMGPQAEAE
jgi:hypothetical protein